MQERYQIDLSEPGLLDQRSARWLRVRILALADLPHRLYRATMPAPTPEELG